MEKEEEFAAAIDREGRPKNVDADEDEEEEEEEEEKGTVTGDGALSRRSSTVAFGGGGRGELVRTPPSPTPSSMRLVKMPAFATVSFRKLLSTSGC